MPLTSFYNNHLYKWKFKRIQEDIGRSTITQNKHYAFVDSNYYSFISSAYWEVVTTWFYCTGCHHFALSKIILHVHVQNGWIWKPFDIFHFVTLHWSGKNQLNTTILNWKPVHQHKKNVSFFPLTWSWPCLHFFVCRNVAIFNRLLKFYITTFYLQCVGFCIQ